MIHVMGISIGILLGFLVSLVIAGIIAICKRRKAPTVYTSDEVSMIGKSLMDEKSSNMKLRAGMMLVIASASNAGNFEGMTLEQVLAKFIAIARRALGEAS